MVSQSGTAFAGAMLTTARIARAFEMLSAGRSVTDTSAHAGFGSDRTMRTAFREHLGVSPREAPRTLDADAAAARLAAGAVA